MLSARTCRVGCRTVAQFVADHAGEVATEWSLGHKQCCSIFGDCSHIAVDGDSLMKPAEVGVCPPGFATNQRGVRHVDADGDVVHCFCNGREKTVRRSIKRGEEDGAGQKQERMRGTQPWASVCYKIRIMANGCPRGSHTENHERRLMLSGEPGSFSETIMRPESEAYVGEWDDGKKMEAGRADVRRAELMNFLTVRGDG